MDWITMDRALLSHVKTKRAARALCISPVTMVGHLFALWSWCAENAKDGNLSSFEAWEIADAAAWTEDPELFVDAMSDKKWLDKTDDSLHVHDWWEHAGERISRYEEKRAKNAERMREARSKGVQRTCNAHGLHECVTCSDSIPPKRKSKREILIPPSIPPAGGSESQVSSDGEKSESTNAYPADFEEAWKAYPQRAGGNSKKAAFKAWSARLKEGVPPQVLLEGVARYRTFCEATGKIGSETVKMAASFFGPNEHYLEAWGLPGQVVAQAGSPSTPNSQPSIDPESVRLYLRQFLAPLLLRDGMTKEAASAFMRDAPVDDLKARLGELRAKYPPKEGDRGAA